MQNEDHSVISDSESAISGTSLSLLPQHTLLVNLQQGDALHHLIKTRFLRGLGQLGPKTQVLSIQRNACSTVVSQARLQSFNIYANSVAKLRHGNANVKYAWYGTRGEDDLNDVVSHGFGYSHGPKLILSPDHNPLQSVKGCAVGKDGVRHALLCRVILGKSEIVNDVCTDQCYPSCEDFDSGVDSLLSPNKYIIWSNSMNTHVLPAYVVSFRVCSSFKGIEKSEEEEEEKGLRPCSPWMPFPTLISVLSKILAPCDVAVISKLYKDKKERKISRHELIQRVRRITGDKLLVAAIKSYRDKKKTSFMQTRSKNGLPTRTE